MEIQFYVKSIAADPNNRLRIRLEAKDDPSVFAEHLLPRNFGHGLEVGAEYTLTLTKVPDGG